MQTSHTKRFAGFRRTSERNSAHVPGEDGWHVRWVACRSWVKSLQCLRLCCSSRCWTGKFESLRGNIITAGIFFTRSNKVIQPAVKWCLATGNNLWQGKAWFCSHSVTVWIWVLKGCLFLYVPCEWLASVFPQPWTGWALSSIEYGWMDGYTALPPEMFVYSTADRLRNHWSLNNDTWSKYELLHCKL